MIIDHSSQLQSYCFNCNQMKYCRKLPEEIFLWCALNAFFSTILSPEETTLSNGAGRSCWGNGGVDICLLIYVSGIQRISGQKASLAYAAIPVLFFLFFLFDDSGMRMTIFCSFRGSASSE